MSASAVTVGKYVNTHVNYLLEEDQDFEGKSSLNRHVTRIEAFDKTINGKDVISFIRMIFFTIFKCFIPKRVKEAIAAISMINLVILQNTTKPHLFAASQMNVHNELTRKVVKKYNRLVWIAASFLCSKDYRKLLKAKEFVNYQKNLEIFLGIQKEMNFSKEKAAGNILKKDSITNIQNIVKSLIDVDGQVKNALLSKIESINTIIFVLSPKQRA